MSVVLRRQKELEDPTGLWKVVHGCEETLAETWLDGVLANRVSPCSQKRIESSEPLLLEDGLRFLVKAL